MIESLIGLAAVLILAMLRLPIAFAMGFVGFVGFGLQISWSASLTQIGHIASDAALDYGLSVVPLFILMGALVTRAKLSDDLFTASNAFLGHFRGGLSMATVVACGGFGAICGSSVATAATMAKVAMPSMRRYGYADSLATGSIAAGGTLGILIPPSVVLIVYGLLTESDIGKLFIAGVIPGLLGVLFYIAAVAVVVRLNPETAPRSEGTEPFSDRERIGVIAVGGLFILIMTGIYGDFFTPTEAAGVGAGAAFLIAVLVGGVGAGQLFQACVETARTTAMIFAIIMGAEIFSNFINFAGLPEALVSWIGGLDVDAYLVIAGIVVIYLVLGCVMESLSMILLTVPVFVPLMYELDFGVEVLRDPESAVIWFAVIVVVVTEISLITPPVGLNVFVLRSVLPDVPLSTIFRGVVPFWIADIVRLLLLIALPTLSLWLVGWM